MCILINIIYSLFTVWRESRWYGVSFGEFFILSLRLFGGFIPQLREIKNGSVTSISWLNFSFGSYSYAKFASAIENTRSSLKRVIMTSKTLRSLSKFLCYYKN